MLNGPDGAHMLSVGKGRGRGIENFDFSYLMYWKKQGGGIENWENPKKRH